MSRCYPFPPPGYIKNAPVELELSLKKEKRKHKKKKKKKHSGANGDVTVEDGDQHTKDIEQSGAPSGGFGVGLETLPSATVSRGAIPRLQTESSGDEAFPNCARVMDLKREGRKFKSKEKVPLSNTVAAQSLHAGASRTNGLSNGVNGTMRVQNQEGMLSTMEVLADGGLGTGHKRYRVHSSRDESYSASGHKRPEEAEDSVFSSGVLSTKRKRLQADNSRDLIPKGLPAADCKRSKGLPAGTSESNIFLHAIDSTTLKADNFQKLPVSKYGLPFNSEGSEQRLRSDNQTIRVAADGACSTTGQAEIRKAREMPSHLLANKAERQADKSKFVVQSKGVMSSCQNKLQGESSKVRPPTNDMLTAKGDRSDIKPQTGKKLLMNNVRDSRVSLLPADTLNERIVSGSSIASTSKNLDQRLQGTNKVILSGLSNAKVKRSEVDNAEGLVDSHSVQGTSNQRLHMVSSHLETQASVMLDKKVTADKTCNTQGELLANHEHSDTRLQVHPRNGVLTNGVLATHLKESNKAIKVGSHASLPGSLSARQKKLNEPIKVGSSLSSPERNIINETAAPNSITAARKSLLELEEQSIKEKLMKLRITHAEQSWVTGEDEDWLKSCKQQAQPKEKEEFEDQMLQVWAEGVLLPAVGITALPYVIPS